MLKAISKDENTVTKKTQINQAIIEKGGEIYDFENTKINISMDLTKEERKRAQELIKKHIHLFTTDPTNVRRANVEPYKLRLKDNEPVALRAYKLAPVERRAIKEILAQMESEELVSRSSSSYSAPAFAKRKSNNTYRLLCNYQKLNMNIIIDKNAVPRIENVFMALQGSKYFCVLDAN